MSLSTYSAIKRNEITRPKNKYFSTKKKENDGSGKDEISSLRDVELASADQTYIDKLLVSRWVHLTVHEYIIFAFIWAEREEKGGKNDKTKHWSDVSDSQCRNEIIIKYTRRYHSVFVSLKMKGRGASKEKGWQNNKPGKQYDLLPIIIFNFSSPYCHFS